MRERNVIYLVTSKVALETYAQWAE